MSKKDIREFIEYIEEFVPIQKYQPPKRSKIGMLIIPEFTIEDWRHLKETGDWRTLRKRDEQAYKEALEPKSHCP